MRGRAIIPMVMGLAVGLVALKVFVNVLQKAKGATSTDLVSVVYATTNIEPTLEIQDSMLEIRQISKAAAPDTGFADKSEVVGRVTTWPIPKGTPVGAMQLAPKGTPPGMAVMIEEGYRAVAVKIDESAGVAGWIKPGSRVDVVAMLSNPDRSHGNQSFSKVILQNVEVLAVGQEIGRAGDTAAAITKTVTLLVTPNEVPKLHLAESKGKLRLAMRSQRDSRIAREHVTTDNDLLSLGSTQDSVSRSSGSSLLSAIFGGQAKPGSDQTDKDQQPATPIQPATTVALADSGKPWTVELYKGPAEVETLSFEQKDHTWQRVDARDQRSNRPRLLPAAAASASPAPAPKAAPTPVSLFAPRPAQPALSNESANQPQANGSGTEGPAGNQ